MTARIRVDGTLATMVPAEVTPAIQAAMVGAKQGRINLALHVLSYRAAIAAAPASYAEAVVEMRAALVDALFAMDGVQAGDMKPGGPTLAAAMTRARAALARITVEVDDAG